MKIIEIIGYVILVVSYIIGIWLIIKFNLEKKKKSSDDDREESNIIVQERQYFYIIITCFIGISSLIFVFLEGFIPLVPPLSAVERLVVFLMVYLVTCLPCLYVALMCVNWKVAIYDDFFTFRNAFGITKTYKFEEVILKECSAGNKVYKSNKWLFNISYSLNNASTLNEALIKHDMNQRQEGQ